MISIMSKFCAQICQTSPFKMFHETLSIDHE